MPEPKTPGPARPPHPDRAKKPTEQIPAFSPMSGKYGPEKLSIWALPPQRQFTPQTKKDHKIQMLHVTRALLNEFVHFVPITAYFAKTLSLKSSSTICLELLSQQWPKDDDNKKKNKGSI